MLSFLFSFLARTNSFFSTRHAFLSTACPYLSPSFLNLIILYCNGKFRGVGSRVTLHIQVRIEPEWSEVFSIEPTSTRLGMIGYEMPVHAGYHEFHEFSFHG